MGERGCKKGVRGERGEVGARKGREDKREGGRGGGYKDGGEGKGVREEDLNAEK